MQKEVGVSESCKDGGVLPDTGFPRVSGMETSDNSDTVQTYGSSHTTCIHPRASSRGYTFEVCISGRSGVMRCRCSWVVVGSSGTRGGVVEVVVHGSDSS